MGSGASAADVPQPGRPEVGQNEPDLPRSSTPAGRSVNTLQADEETEKPESHTVDIQSLKSDNNKNEEEEEIQEVEQQQHDDGSESVGRALTPAPVTDSSVSEAEEVSLDIESFLHSNGMLYSCFNHHGNRVYVDESQNLQPFPKDWYNQGRFLNTNNQGSGSSQTQSSSQPVSEDDRTGSLYIQGKGNVMTYMFEERVNVCRWWDPVSGVWLLLPLQWELEVEFVKARVQRVMSSLPGLVDQSEITAALRQCNYDSDEVVSVYITMFGETLLSANQKGDPNYRALVERDRVIEDLSQKLQRQEKETDRLLQTNNYLAREVRYLGEVVETQNLQLAELETEREENQEKIKSQRQRSAGLMDRQETTTNLQPLQLQQVGRLTRELNISNKQLRSTVHQTLKDIHNHQDQLKGAVIRLAQAEQESGSEVTELRSLYRKECSERKRLYNKLLELQGNIRVFCRLRNKPDKSTSCLDENTTEEEVVVLHKGNKKRFQFDKVFNQSSTQEEVFAGTLPVITSCVDGYNVCILAYGQTGSGKTFTMMGSRANPGVNIRSIRELLRICSEKQNVSYSLKMSMLEIYNDSLNDLLTKSPGAPLDLRVQGKSVTVPGLTQVIVQTEDDIIVAMETGEKNRKIASTKMNTQSSRSHLLVALQVEGSDSASGLKTRATLTLCDLAGSERINKTEAEGHRLVEAAAINKSLTALGQVFSALKANALHVPFRNSKLTHLLQPSLSGEAKCCVFVNVSPDLSDVGETLSTLQFGSTIRQVSLGKTTQNITPKNKTAK